MKKFITLAIISSLAVPCFGQDKIIGIYNGDVHNDEDRKCTLEISARKDNTLNIKASYEMGLFTPDRVFNFQVKNLVHPATDPNWDSNNINFSEHTYAYTAHKKSGESIQLYLDKSSGSLVPDHYFLELSKFDSESLDGASYPWFNCMF